MFILFVALFVSCGRDVSPAAVPESDTETTSAIAETTEYLTELTYEPSAESETASLSEVTPQTNAANATMRTSVTNTTSASRAAAAATTTTKAQTTASRTTAATTKITTATQTAAVTSTIGAVIRPGTTVPAATTTARASTVASTTTSTTHVTTTSATTTSSPSPGTSPGAVTPATTTKPAEKTVSFEIDGSAAVSYGYDVFLPARTMTLNNGDSVFDLLGRSGVAITSDKSFLGVYVSSIGGLREKACGGSSGWVYEVNGTRPGTSCDKYPPKDGDVIVWRYSLTP